MRLFPAIIAAVFLGGAVALFWGSYAYFRADELAKAEARLSLYRSTVEAELKRFSHLTYILARDSVVIETAKNGDSEALNTRLASFVDRAGIDAIFLMDTEGNTTSASNAAQPGSFVGQNYAFRPYFQVAMQGRQGAFYGIGATTGIPGYFFAEPVKNSDGEITGVIAIKIDLAALQDSWQQAGERILLANADGIALLASVPEWRYRALEALPQAQLEKIRAARQFGTEPLLELDWNAEDQEASIDGKRFLYLQSSDLPNGWSLHFFASDDQAVRNAWLATIGLLMTAGLTLIAYQVQRVRRIGAALRRSEDEEAQLRAANERLAVEIEERRTAEQRLQKTQAELERAGRLAALGQLASSVTHELGQPIAAMRNHLAVAEMHSGATPQTEKLQGLVSRMEGITRQLKFFSRKGRDQFENVDLVEAMRAVLDLLEPNLHTAEAQVRFDHPDAPVILHANRLRIEQVMTNLVRNALDAMADAEHPEVRIEIGQDDNETWFQVSDNGHGIGDRTMEELREPFATTRESGQGMGLGLTISAGIVDDHNGKMTARNNPGSGATMRASFPRHIEGEAA